MIFFLDEYLLQKNSSVEHAAVKRLALFKRFNQPAVILTRDFDRLSVRTLEKMKIAQTDVLNMFDYFQHIPSDMPEKTVLNDEMNLPTLDEVSVDANQSQVTDGDRLRRQVGYIPETYGHVFYQNYLDDQGNEIERDLWDARGFRSATQYFGRDGLLTFERYYDLDGKPVIETYYAGNQADQMQLTRVVLKGKTILDDREFDDLDGLFTHFLDELADADPGETVFISDRPGVGVLPLMNMQQAAKKFIYVPINHVVNNGNQQTDPVDGYLKPAFADPAKIDGFIVQTPSQRDAIVKRFPTAKVTAIPAVTIDPDTLPQKPDEATTDVNNKKLMYVGRIAEERQLDQMIRALGLVNSKIPGVELDLYGYGDADYQKKLEALTKDLKLDKQVHFKDYVTDLDQRYEQYTMLLNTAATDGGPLAILEAQTHGLPVISYRFHYGPSDEIANKEDGYLVPQNDLAIMAKLIVDLLQHPEKRAAFGQKALENVSQRLDEASVYKQWQQVLGL
ncbi:glycosyltransferase [Lacticaseibacillus zeae]|uniref:Glycosyltransferase n=1 Tax=Lacticaseibacillus zeae subsp. silagei TaxID=3068307 RepID=A0ABD7Z8G0_LACZE|nr:MULTISPECIES: glycosyltransferase [Lacticaseibacillus]MDE3316108.1 glycosyltransferase [Lacticaseibacillus zeae]OFR93436.1 poly(glycerol-phosphate) alpha-glucosyltransferase [Lactobacillus sp. HMSC068F07]WLV83147.1 glycosyltransferase [Lacticaseibacillus sp. NCIMB 15475]WLV85896.1 glycosyltransferase [Lacticaseibacillus sp. NCIMB 15474]